MPTSTGPLSFEKILLLKGPDAPEHQRIFVFQDQNGFLYLRKLVNLEGPSTPFSSVAEIGIYLEMPLTVAEEFTKEEYEKFIRLNER